MNNLNNPRSIHKLLELLLYYLGTKYFTSGLCLLIYVLKYYDIITCEERNILLIYIINNNPNNKDMDTYYWPPGKIIPRKKWLKEHIELTK